MPPNKAGFGRAVHHWRSHMWLLSRSLQIAAVNRSTNKSVLPKWALALANATSKESQHNYTIRGSGIGVWSFKRLL